LIHYGLCARAEDATGLPSRPNTAQRIRAFLAAAGHADDLDAAMFRPLSHNRKGQESRRHMDPDVIDRALRIAPIFCLREIEACSYRHSE
jgi:hypothetical protein